MPQIGPVHLVSEVGGGGARMPEVVMMARRHDVGMLRLIRGMRRRRIAPVMVMMAGRWWRRAGNGGDVIRADRAGTGDLRREQRAVLV